MKCMIISSICDSTLSFWGAFKDLAIEVIWGSDARFWSPGEAEAGSGSRVRQRHERPVRWGRGKRPGHQWPPVHHGQVTSFTSPLITHYILSAIFIMLFYIFFVEIWPISQQSKFGKPHDAVFCFLAIWPPTDHLTGAQVTLLLRCTAFWHLTSNL